MSGLPEWTKSLFVGDREDYALDADLLARATCISARGMAWPNDDACIGIVFAQAKGAEQGIARLFIASPELAATAKALDTFLSAAPLDGETAVRVSVDDLLEQLRPLRAALAKAGQ